MPLSIKQSLSATGTTDAADVKAADFFVSGTFVATWSFQALINDEWVTIERGTAPGSYLDVRFAVLRSVRFNVEAYTSGTIAFSLNGRSFG